MLPVTGSPRDAAGISIIVPKRPHPEVPGPAGPRRVQPAPNKKGPVPRAFAKSLAPVLPAEASAPAAIFRLCLNPIK